MSTPVWSRPYKAVLVRHPPLVRRERGDITRDECIEMDRTRALYRRPLFKEHDTRLPLGVVDRSWIQKDDGDSLCGEFKIDLRSDVGQNTAMNIEKGIFNGVSLTHDMKTGEPLELSVVKFPARTGTWIFNASAEESVGGIKEKIIENYVDILENNPNVAIHYNKFSPTLFQELNISDEHARDNLFSASSLLTGNMATAAATPAGGGHDVKGLPPPPPATPASTVTAPPAPASAAVPVANGPTPMTDNASSSSSSHASQNQSQSNPKPTLSDLINAASKPGALDEAARVAAQMDKRRETDNPNLDAALTAAGKDLLMKLASDHHKTLATAHQESQNRERARLAQLEQESRERQSRQHTDEQTKIRKREDEETITAAARAAAAAAVSAANAAHTEKKAAEDEERTKRRRLNNAAEDAERKKAANDVASAMTDDPDALAISILSGSADHDPKVRAAAIRRIAERNKETQVLQQQLNEERQKRKEAEEKASKAQKLEGQIALEDLNKTLQSLEMTHPHRKAEFEQTRAEYKNKVETADGAREIARFSLQLRNLFGTSMPPTVPMPSQYHNQQQQRFVSEMDDVREAVGYAQSLGINMWAPQSQQPKWAGGAGGAGSGPLVSEYKGYRGTVPDFHATTITANALSGKTQPVQSEQGYYEDAYMRCSGLLKAANPKLPSNNDQQMDILRTLIYQTRDQFDPDFMFRTNKGMITYERNKSGSSSSSVSAPANGSGAGGGGPGFF